MSTIGRVPASLVVSVPIDLLWILVCSALVLLMQVGFCCLESGLVRAKNSINVALKNLVDYCVSSLAFWLVGAGLMFGPSLGGWLGWGRFADFPADATTGSFLLFQMVFCGTATTIISGAVAERLRFAAYVAVALLVAAVIYPVFGHWAWGGAEPGAATVGWLRALGFIDFAGSTVVHSVGAWTALIALLYLGPRVGRYGPGGRPIPPHNLALATVGVLILWFGWLGFNGGSTLALTPAVPGILLGTNLAAASGGIAALAVSLLQHRRAEAQPILNGVIGGLVAVTAGVHAFDFVGAAAVGAVGGILAAVGQDWFDRRQVDDAVGAVAAHGVAGAWGTLAVALFGDPALFPAGLGRLDQFLVQLLGVTTAMLWTGVSAGLGLFVIRRFLRFRVAPDDEQIGLNVVEHGASSELLDLISQMRVQRDEGDFSGRVDEEPHTEVGQIAREYNRVLARVQSEIHGREQAILAARRLEEKYRHIYESVVEGIYQCTWEGRALTANPAYINLLGYGDWQALAGEIQSIGTQVHVDPRRWEEWRRRADEEGLVTGFESEIRRADGRTRWISESVRAVRDAYGSFLYFEATVRDITSERAARTALEAATRAAVEANRVKSAFLANMSHELRTPLGIILGYAELLAEELRERLPEDEREQFLPDVRTIEDSGRHLLHLINSLLDFSKIEAGRMEADWETVDVPMLIETVAAQMAPLVRASNNTLDYSVDEAVGTFVCDPVKLQQCLLNLLSNATKFTEGGSIALAVEPDAAGGNLRFVVRDTGIGMSEEQLGKLFRPFTQADSSTTRRYGGTGLGLAITRSFCQLLGGEVLVESALGHGSTFTLVLPWRREVPAGGKTGAGADALITADAADDWLQLPISEQGSAS